MHGLRLPRLFTACGSGPGRAPRAGGKAAGRAQFAAQHRAGHGRLAHERSQAGKKKRRKRPRRCRAGGRRKPSASDGRYSNWMRGGRLWGANNEKGGYGWPSSAPADASWPGCWVSVARPPVAGSGRHCPPATAAPAGTTPTSGPPMPPCCLRTPTGATNPARPRWSKPSIAPCASVAACWYASLARSASR